MTTLLCCQLVGEAVSQGLGVPIPGPVLGLLLLLALLVVRRGPTAELQGTAGTLLRHLSLLFVPAGVGVVTQLDALRANWLPVTVAILVSTALGLGVTGWVMQRLSRGMPE